MSENAHSPAVPPVWRARVPADWPSLPEYLTYSTLREFEVCPRRWALASASYPEVWTGRGYPRRLSMARIAGTIVHDVIETITRALVEQQCPSIFDERAVQIMRASGGFTRLLEDSASRNLRPYVENPRTRTQVEAVRRNLQTRFGDLRRKAQTLLSTVRAIPNGRGAPTTSVRPASKRRRRALSPGTHAEVDVFAAPIGWKGRLDLLTVAPLGCEITEFKTGEQSAEHALQLRIYALLWSMDRVLNPTATPTTSLTVVYPQGQTKVPAPLVEELDALQADLVARTEAARAYQSVRPPARPSPSNCLRCEVRQLCDEYWTSDVQRLIHTPTTPLDTYDGEFMLGNRLGTSNWQVDARLVAPVLDKAPTVLRCADPKIDLTAGQVVRVLDGRALTTPEDAATVTIEAGPSSEIYLVQPLPAA